MRTRRAAVAASLLALLLSGCASGLPAAGPTPDPTSTGPTVTESTRPPFQTGTPGPIGPTGTPVATVPEDRWTAILRDLAARGETASAELVSAEQVTFTDGSLGCPEPGQSYTLALVDGMRIVVSVDGVRFDYRFGAGDTPKLCNR